MDISQLPINILIYDVARLARRSFDRRARPLGLTQPQWRMLAVLSKSEGINQVSLADILDIQPITLTRQLDRLEASGWVERRPNPTDRRAIQLFLTPKAQPLVDKIWKVGEGVVRDMLDAVPEADRDQTREVLMKMRENLLGVEGAEAPGESETDAA
jgi:MarR family transcriptional regulator, transcriptional regulator for hemolysin